VCLRVFLIFFIFFCQRRNGFIQKAKKFDVLCDVEVGLIFFTPTLQNSMNLPATDYLLKINN